MPGPRALLLAAGRGSRFGGDKLLAPLDGRPLVAHAVACLMEAGLPPLAVVGLDDSELAAALEALGCEVLATDRSALGIGGSLSAAVEASANAHGWIVALGDMPRVPVNAVVAVARALEGGALVAAPVHRGQRGHPVGFGRALYGDLIQLRDDVGARDIVQAHRDRLVLVEADAGVLADVDTTADLARIAGDEQPRGLRGRS